MSGNKRGGGRKSEHKRGGKQEVTSLVDFICEATARQSDKIVRLSGNIQLLLEV